jgi:hypothetical protein
MLWLKYYIRTVRTVARITTIKVLKKEDEDIIQKSKLYKREGYLFTLLYIETEGIQYLS